MSSESNLSRSETTSLHSRENDPPRRCLHSTPTPAVGLDVEVAGAGHPGLSHGWDSRFLDLARLVASWSKDPSTGTGCVIVRPDRTIASVGYNGFARGVEDTAERLNDRPTKYAMTVHAEVNAIVAAREPLHGCTAYVHPWFPCSPCAAAVIQAGIVRLVSLEATAEQQERWADSWALAETMLNEAGVKWERR